MGYRKNLRSRNLYQQWTNDTGLSDHDSILTKDLSEMFTMKNSVYKIIVWNATSEMVNPDNSLTQ